jgi:hypothetical protein
VGDDGEGVAVEVVSGSGLQRSTSAAEAGLPAREGHDFSRAVTASYVTRL